MHYKKPNTFLLTLLISLLFTQFSFSKTAEEIDAGVDKAIEQFKQQIKGGEGFLPKVKGYLVFPRIIKAGVIVGGKYGEGALRVNDETIHYFDMSSATVGLQAGAQEYSMLIAFISDTALNNFLRSNGWEAGIDGSITVSNWGQNIDLSTISFEKPIMAFIYNAKGLMASVSVGGTKFRRISP
ncbi:putative lipoprotein [hydrothermal vent metagenome]|uniref:Putative lipoprotein n=1 Tax=hydrothermal vent metagenome TaxID=652676 RepID=A0A1W1CZH8_9ZZZZ